MDRQLTKPVNEDCWAQRIRIGWIVAARRRPKVVEHAQNKRFGMVQ